MKREIFFTIVLSMLCFFGLLGCICFRKTQAEAFHHTKAERESLRQKHTLLKEDLVFLESHQKEIDFLKKKGWFSPTHRLVVAEFLENIIPLSVAASYRFDSQVDKKILREDFSFKVTQIVFDMSSSLDLGLYIFIEKLLKAFPGILIPRELTVTRQEKGPLFIKGKFVFEWISMKEKGHESLQDNYPHATSS